MRRSSGPGGSSSAGAVVGSGSVRAISSIVSGVTADPTHQDATHLVSVVVPVYNGERSLTALLGEIAKLTTPGRTPAGRLFRVVEVLLVPDCGRDDSPRVMR